MSSLVGIGLQSFEFIRENDCFYVDKTKFIKEWWGNKDSVTLLTRPRRFGKTLTMSMETAFFRKICWTNTISLYKRLMYMLVTK